MIPVGGLAFEIIVGDRTEVDDLARIGGFDLKKLRAQVKTDLRDEAADEATA